MLDSADLNSPEPNRDWTFALYPGAKHTFNAGDYDSKTRKPHYSFQMRAPQHVGNMITVKEYRIQTAGDDLQMWEVDNKSSWVVFVTIKRDGELIRLSDPLIRH